MGTGRKERDLTFKINLGKLAKVNGDFQVAINIFREILDKDSKNIDCWEELAETFLLAGELEAALWAYNKMLNYSAYIPKSIFEKIRFLEERLFQKTRQKLKVKTEFRTFGDFIYIRDKTDKLKWSKFIVKGINIGLGIPGYFPGEFAITKKNYLDWFSLIYELGLNTVRVYSLKNPAFYEALYEFNMNSTKLYLLQGIWYEPPENHELYDDAFLSKLKRDIRETVDAVHGELELKEEKGKPAGKYIFDVSGCLLGYFLSREPEPCMVKYLNDKARRNSISYVGDFLKLERGNLFEKWVCQLLDEITKYSFSKYQKIPLVSVVSWPNLDPMEHLSESSVEEELRFFHETEYSPTSCIDSDDLESFDTTKIHSKVDNFFTTYHIYPYHPDFMVNDYLDCFKPYLCYLRDLKNIYRKRAVLVGEFGIPTSRVSAHWHPHGWTHGGVCEKEQGHIIGEMIDHILSSSYAGFAIFSLFDEWYKRTWLFGNFYKPFERKPKWFNFQDPEENYGIIRLYPGYPTKLITLSGNYDEWRNALILYKKDMVDTSSPKFVEVRITHDEGFVYIMIMFNIKVDFDRFNILIGIDTGYKMFGEFRFPCGVDRLSPIGLKYVIHIAGKNSSRILVTSSYNKYLSHQMSPKKQIFPDISRDGKWSMMIVKTNRRRVSKNKDKIYIPRFYNISKLNFGSLNPRDTKSYNDLADFYFLDNILEIRLPWELLNFTDPSEKRMLWLTETEETRISDGIRLVGVLYETNRDLWPKCSTVLDYFPDDWESADLVTYNWDPWNYPTFHQEIKQSYHYLRRKLENT